jgi:hypothetical protein
VSDDGNATVFYLVLGKTPLGKPAMAAARVMRGP